MTSAVHPRADYQRPLGAEPQPVLLGPVSKTLLIPLWARATETRKHRPLVRDDHAAELCDRIDYDFSIFRHAHGTQIGCVLRGLLYDQWVSDFLARHPHGTIVELGAGLSTRFERIDNGTARWIDVDLPDAMRLRRALFRPSPRRRFVGGSVIDRSSLQAVAREGHAPYFFVSEGMLMYLAEADVRTLLSRVADTFGPVEIALDAIAPFVVRHQSLHDTMKHMMDAPFRWGIRDLHELQSWDERIAVREVATLPAIARRFRDRIRVRHRVAGMLLERAFPSIARGYQICRLEIG